MRHVSRFRDGKKSLQMLAQSGSGVSKCKVIIYDSDYMKKIPIPGDTNLSSGYIHDPRM